MVATAIHPDAWIPGPQAQGWTFSYGPGDADDEPLFHPEAHPLRVGEYVTVTERDGTPLAFLISLSEPLAA